MTSPQEECNEIFHDVSNKNDNIPNDDETKIQQECLTEKSNINCTKMNNNHHVVPVGVLIVIFTLYLTATALHRNYDYYMHTTATAEATTTTTMHEPQQETQVSNDNEGLPHIPAAHTDHEQVHQKQERCASISSNSVEDTDDVCENFEIFTKRYESVIKDKQIGITNKNVHKRRNGYRNGNGKKSKRKYLNGRNGHGENNKNNHHNKSKQNNANTSSTLKALLKKDQQAKKNSTAEPIIYLFALVFIYLLLKAASDINQHYKSQSKGDKRLRRCSLQSYAQQHKQDRRASKESPIHCVNKKHKQQYFMEYRSKSVEPYTEQPITNYIAKRREILANIRKYTSIDNPQQKQHILYTWNTDTNLLASKNYRSTGSQSDLSALQDRRCSVPAAHRSYFAKSSTIDRRISIAGSNILQPAGNSLDNIDQQQFPEIKRRVRMINRH